MTKIKQRHDKMIRSEIEDKTHYKLYKSGKNWLVCGITVFTFAAGTTGRAVHAQDVTKDDNSQQKVNTINSSDNSLQKQTVTLKTQSSQANASTSTSSASSNNSSSQADTSKSVSAQSNESSTAVSKASQTVSQSTETSASQKSSSVESTSAVKASSTSVENTTPITKASQTSTQSVESTKQSQATSATSTSQATASAKSTTESNTQSAVKSTSQSTSKVVNQSSNKLNVLTNKGTNNSESVSTSANQTSATSQSNVAAESAATNKATSTNLSTLATITKLLPAKTTVSLTNGMLTIALPSGVDPDVAKRAVKAAGINGPVSITGVDATDDTQKASATVNGETAAVGDIDILSPTQFNSLRDWVLQTEVSGNPETVDDLTRQLATGQWYRKAMQPTILNGLFVKNADFDNGYLSIMKQMLTIVGGPNMDGQGGYIGDLTQRLSEKNMSFADMQTMSNGIFSSVNTGSEGTKGLAPTDSNAAIGILNAFSQASFTHSSYLQVTDSHGNSSTTQAILPTTSVSLTDNFVTGENDIGYSTDQSEQVNIGDVLNNIIPVYVALIVNAAEYQTAYNAFHTQNTLGVAPSQSVVQDYINQIIDEHADDIASDLGMPSRIGDLVASMPMLNLSDLSIAKILGMNKDMRQEYSQEHYTETDGSTVYVTPPTIINYGVFENIYTALKTDIIKAIAGTYMLQRNQDLAKLTTDKFDASTVVAPDFTSGDVIDIATKSADAQVAKLVPVRALGKALTAGTPMTQAQFDAKMSDSTSSVYDANYAGYSATTKALYYNVYLSGVGKHVNITFKSADQNTSLQDYLKGASTRSPIYAQVGSQVDFNLLQKEDVLPYLPAGYEYAPAAQQNSATTITDSDTNYTVIVGPAQQSIPVYFTDVNGKAVIDPVTKVAAQVNLMGTTDSPLDALSGANLTTINNYVQSLYSVDGSGNHVSYAVVANQSAKSDGLTATTSFTLKLTQAYSVTVQFRDPDDANAVVPKSVKISAAQGTTRVDLSNDPVVKAAIEAANVYRLATSSDFKSGEKQPTSFDFSLANNGLTETVYVVKNNVQQAVQYKDSVTGAVVGSNVTVTHVAGSSADLTQDATVTTGIPTGYQIATGTNELNGNTQPTSFTFSANSLTPVTVYLVKKAQITPAKTGLTGAAGFSYTINGGTKTTGTFGTDVINASEGDQVVIIADDVKGYDVTNPQTITVAATNTNPVFAYTLKKISVTIKHEDINNHPIGTDTVSSVDYGSQYFDNADAVDGYTLVTASDANKVTQTMDDDKPVEVVYKYMRNATATLTLTDKVYDGTALVPMLTVKDAGGNALTNVTLDSTDYTLTNSNDPLTQVNAGTYTIVLNNPGQKKIKDANPDYYFTNLGDTATGQITPKTVTVKGTDVKVPYDGQPHTLSDATFTGVVGATNPTVSYSVKKTDAGSYDITPTAAANVNYTYSYQPGKLTIDKLATTATLTGSETSKTYDGTGISFVPTMTFSVTNLKTNNPTYKLTAADLQVYDPATKQVVTNPTNAGQYQLQLTDPAKTAIKDANPNFDIDFTGATYEYTISPVELTATVDGSSKVYDGTKITTAPTVTFQRKDAKTNLIPTTVDLAAADYTITGNAAKVGDYTVDLTTTGLTDVQNKIGSNYQLVSADVKAGTDKITPRPVKITYSAAKVAYDGTAHTLTPTVEQSNGDRGVIKGETLEFQNPSETNAGVYNNLQGTTKADSTVNSNYTITYDPATLEIDAQTGSASIKSGNALITSGSSTYNGQTVDYQPTLVYGDQTKLLASDQYTMTKTTDGVTTTASEIKDAGTYQIKLTGQYLTTLKNNGNYKMDNWDTLEGTYTVTPADVTLALNGGSKTYDGNAVSASDYTPAVTFTNTTDSQLVPTLTTPLTFADVTIHNNDGSAVDHDITLTDAGTKAVSADTNFKYTNLSALKAIYKINKATANVALSFTKTSQVYDGQAMNTLPTISFTETGTATPTVPPLTAADFTITNKAGQTVTSPTNADTYTYKLNQPGLDALNAATNNSNFTFAGTTATTTFDITARPVVINFTNATVT